MARKALLLPLLVFLLLGGLLLRGLQLDPQALPSALIDRPFPDFDLPVLGSDERATRQSVIGDAALFNVWATWCASCRVEHPFLTELARRGVPVYGINYKDVDAAALDWLAELGDPYRFSIVDAEGSLGLDLGVYGAPETYLVDAAGIIRYRHVGVVDERVWEEVLEPILRELQGLDSGRSDIGAEVIPGNIQQKPLRAVLQNPLGAVLQNPLRAVLQNPLRAVLQNPLRALEINPAGQGKGQ